MRNRKATARLVAVSAAFGMLFAASTLALTGIARAQEGPSPERRFQFMDQNRDGRLSRDEWRGRPEAFDRIDRNRDGAITLGELTEFARSRAAPPGEGEPRRREREPGQGEPRRRDREPGPGEAPGTRPRAGDTESAPVAPSAIPVIDTHSHLQPGRGRGATPGFGGAAAAAVAKMDQVGVRLSIIMSPPLPAGREGEYDEGSLLSVARQHPGRFAVMAGGSSLNPMIDGAPKDGTVSPELRQRFQQTAEGLLRSGAVGFGEMTALHFSFYDKHPYEERSPDHPLFLLLADIAARHGVPIDLHMEAVVQPFEVPQALRDRSSSNPARVAENISAFERLLAHNPAAKVIWAHVGMDTTNQRTPELMRHLFRKHRNLYAAIKITQGPFHWVVRPGAGLNPAWRAVMVEFPDRFLIGSDEFYQGVGGAGRQRPQTAAGALEVLRHLPPAVARRIAYENAQAIYRLP